MTAPAKHSATAGPLKAKLATLAVWFLLGFAFVAIAERSVR